MANKPKRKGNGEGTIFYDKSRKRWRCQISYQKYSGEIARKSLSASTKTELIKKRNQLLKDIMEQKICETTDATIVDLLKEDAEYDHNMNRIQDSAYNRRLLTVRIIEKGSLAKIPITKIQTNQINDFLFSIKHYSNSVIDKVYSSMSKAYNLAIHKRLMGYNLMDSPFIRKPKSDKPTKKVVAFTVEEENDFLNYLKDMKINKNAIDYRPMFYIELFAGLRMGEICALTAKDIDLRNRLIHVRNTVTRGINYAIKVGDRTKTQKGYRDVPIQDCLVPILKEVLTNYKENDNGLLFYNFKSNRPISTSQVNGSFTRICKKLNIEISGGQHLLRHTFATRVIESGISAEVLKNWMGHTDISVTINTYCDVFDRLNNPAMEQFNTYCQQNLSI